jgi:hypothetical protein
MLSPPEQMSDALTGFATSHNWYTEPLPGTSNNQSSNRRPPSFPLTSWQYFVVHRPHSFAERTWYLALIQVSNSFHCIAMFWPNTWKLHVWLRYLTNNKIRAANGHVLTNNNYIHHAKQTCVSCCVNSTQTVSIIVRNASYADPHAQTAIWVSENCAQMQVLAKTQASERQAAMTYPICNTAIDRTPIKATHWVDELKWHLMWQSKHLYWLEIDKGSVTSAKRSLSLSMICSLVYHLNYRWITINGAKRIQIAHLGHV